MKVGQKNKVGIVMATYKMDPGMVRQAVLSIVAQSMPAWNLYIIGVKGDKTIEELYEEMMPEERIGLWLDEEPNVYEQRNYGLKLAVEDCDFVTFFDSDDFMLPYKLMMELMMAELDGLDLVYTSYYYADKNLVIFKHCKVSKAASKHQILESCWLPDYTLVKSEFMRKHLQAEDGTVLNQKKYKTACVYDMWMRAIENNARIGMHTAPTWLYRQREDGLGRQMDAPQLLDREMCIKDAKARWGVNTPTRMGTTNLWESGDDATYD